MAVTAEALRQLHRLHIQLADLRGRLERGPRQVNAHAANVAKLEAAVREAQHTVQQTRMNADRKQLELKAAEQRVADWKVQLNACTSNKEYQTLQEQIAAAEMAGSVLADEILEALERVDTLVAEAAEAQRRLEAGREEHQRVEAQVAEAAAGLKAEIARLEADLKDAESRMLGDFKSAYMRIVRAKGVEGLAAVEDGVCTGCGQQITLNMQNDLAMSRPVFCQSCGAMLYPSE